MKLAVSKTENLSFTTHVNQHMGALKAYCRSLTKSSWDADDLIQETLLKAFKSWKKQPRELSKAFFIRIASNTWIDQYRKRALPIEENQDVYELKHDESKISDDNFRILEQVMQKLSPKQRTTLLLTEGLGLNDGETAKWLGESTGAVKATLHRARRKLKGFEKDMVSDDGDEAAIFPYINALNEGSPESIVQLYRQETGVPMMSLAGSTPGLGGFSQVLSRNGVSYVLITITLKSGTQLTIPFYRKEWLALFANFEEGCAVYVLTA